MIRKARESDAAKLSAFINRAYRGASSRSGWTTEADFLDGTRTHEDLLLNVIRKPGSMILLLYEEDSLAGCVELRQEGERMYLGMLTVDPERQGKGYGKHLMKVAEEEARQAGCTIIYMTVINKRTELIAWYERHGYTDRKEQLPFAFDDPRYGQPREPLVFTVLEKKITLQ